MTATSDKRTRGDGIIVEFWQVGDYAGARPYLERALATRETALGPDHPDTATSLDHLGLLLPGKIHQRFAALA